MGHIGYGAYGMGYGTGFGDCDYNRANTCGIDGTCYDANGCPLQEYTIQSVGNQGGNGTNVTVSPGGAACWPSAAGSIPRPGTKLNSEQSPQLLFQPCSPTTGQEVATGIQTGVGIASMFAPFAMMFTGRRQPQPQRPGQPTVVVQGGGSAPNNTPIIIAAVAGVAVLLVVVMMMQNK